MLKLLLGNNSVCAYNTYYWDELSKNNNGNC